MRMRPHGVTSWLSSGLVRHSLPRGAKSRVLLSFDDGPTEIVTEGVLERLADFEARAAFFVIGKQVEKTPDLLLKIVAAGHAVGNHSHTHPFGYWPEFQSYIDDIQQCSLAMEKVTGQRPTLFRSPAGRLHPASLWCAHKFGFKHVLWSLDSNDWKCQTPDDACRAAERVLKEVRDGDIVLLHEYAGWIWDLLDVLLPGLATLGFDLATGLEDLS